MLEITKEDLRAIIREEVLVSVSGLIQEDVPGLIRAVIHRAMPGIVQGAIIQVVPGIVWEAFDATVQRLTAVVSPDLGSGDVRLEQKAQ